MLTRELILKHKGLDVGTTPMLIPSVSSRVNLDIDKILETMSGFALGPVLVSAYDFYHHPHPEKLDISFPELIFLDSGGYECNKEQDISDLGLYKTESKKWELPEFLDIVDNWSTNIPTVLISFDLPSIRKSVEEQIIDAKNIFKDRNDFIKEILIKPESKDSYRVNTDEIIKNITSFKDFDILGFTDKELGYSLFDRMVNIARIRRELDKKKIEIPIHIFGSLDPVTTPLYFFSGADIFDGLSWLRFIYDKNNTYYLDSYGPVLYGPHVNSKIIWGKSISKNYYDLINLKFSLKKFVKNKDFGVFEENETFFKTTYDNLLINIGGD